jgi:hypothetical protein
MSARVLITVCGGVAEYVTEGDVEVNIIDFDNIEAGDAPPDISPEMLELGRDVPGVAGLYEKEG